MVLGVLRPSSLLGNCVCVPVHVIHLISLNREHTHMHALKRVQESMSRTIHLFSVSQNILPIILQSFLPPTFFFYFFFISSCFAMNEVLFPLPSNRLLRGKILENSFIIYLPVSFQTCIKKYPVKHKKRYFEIVFYFNFIIIYFYFNFL